MLVDNNTRPDLLIAITFHREGLLHFRAVPSCFAVSLGAQVHNRMDIQLEGFLYRRSDIILSLLDSPTINLRCDQLG
jgi:hypothetical protein